MEPRSIKADPRRHSLRKHLANSALTAGIAFTVAACVHDRVSVFADWATNNPAERYPILVSKEPTTLALRIPREAYELSPHQRAQTIAFLASFRAGQSGSSKLVIRAPRGTANELASKQAVGEIRDLIRENRFDEGAIEIASYFDRADRQPPIRISYFQYAAAAPDCAYLGANVMDDRSSIGVPGLGCALQANFAAMVADPADLLGPREEAPRASERRDVTWDKYVKGDSTVAAKSEDERVKVGTGE